MFEQTNKFLINFNKIFANYKKNCTFAIVLKETRGVAQSG